MEPRSLDALYRELTAPRRLAMADLMPLGPRIAPVSFSLADLMRTRAEDRNGPEVVMPIRPRIGRLSATSAEDQDRMPTQAEDRTIRPRRSPALFGRGSRRPVASKSNSHISWTPFQSYFRKVCSGTLEKSVTLSKTT